MLEASLVLFSKASLNSFNKPGLFWNGEAHLKPDKLTFFTSPRANLSYMNSARLGIEELMTEEGNG